MIPSSRQSCVTFKMYCDLCGWCVRAYEDGVHDVLEKMARRAETRTTREAEEGGAHIAMMMSPLVLYVRCMLHDVMVVGGLVMMMMMMMMMMTTTRDASAKRELPTSTLPMMLSADLQRPSPTSLPRCRYIGIGIGCIIDNRRK